MAEYIEREATLYRMKVDIAPPFKVVAEMPAADVATVRHGRWILGEDGKWECTECENIAIEHPDQPYKWQCLTTYCPNCGAKMDGGETDA